jgi:hypothetical protein
LCATAEPPIAFDSVPTGDHRTGKIGTIGGTAHDAPAIIIAIDLFAAHRPAGRQHLQIVARRIGIARRALPAWAAGARHFRRIDTVKPHRPATTIAADGVAVMVTGVQAGETGGGREKEQRHPASIEEWIADEDGVLALRRGADQRHRALRQFLDAADVFDRLRR